MLLACEEGYSAKKADGYPLKDRLVGRGRNTTSNYGVDSVHSASKAYVPRHQHHQPHRRLDAFVIRIHLYGTEDKNKIKVE